MTLEEKTIELQSQFPPLKIEQIIEILKNFKPDEEVINEVEETPTEENKEEGKPPAVVETGTTVTAETNEVSDPSDSGNGTSQLSPYALRNLDIIGQRAERTIAMNAAEDLRRSRKSLEEASGFVADFKSSSNVVNEVGVFKDKDGNVIDTSNVEIEEEKIPAPFTQERKDYYDEKDFAYDNTIVQDEQNLPYDFNKKLKQAVSEYEKVNGTDKIALMPDQAKQAGLIPQDSSVTSQQLYSVEEYLKSDFVKNKSLDLMSRINDPSFAEFTPKEITDQAALNHFGKLDDIRIQDTTTFGVGADKESYTDQRYKNKKEYEDYLLKTLGEEKFEQYKLYNPTYSNIYSDDFEGGDFGVTPEQQEQATNELIAKKVQIEMYGAFSEGDLQGRGVGDNRILGIAAKLHDPKKGESQLETKELKILQKDLTDRGVEVEKNNAEIQEKLEPIVKNLNKLSAKKDALLAKIKEHESANVFSTLNPGYKKAIDEYNGALSNHQDAYNE